MGSKISELTETGVAPTGGYIPIEHETANYKLSIKTLLENSTGGGGGEGGIIGYIYCTLPGGGTHEEVLEIDFANQTQSGRNTYNNDLANFHLVDLPQGDIIDMHRPTDAAGSVASWSSDTDFSDCNVLGASGAANFHQPWVMMGNWNKLDSNYVPVGYRGEEFWAAKFENDKLHIKPNPALSLADGNVRTFYFAVTKGGGGGQAAQPSSGVNYTLETIAGGGTLEKKDTSFFEMHVRQLEKDSILVINTADDTFTGFDHSSTRFTTGTLDAVHKDVVYIYNNNKLQAMVDSNGDYNFYAQTTNNNDFYALIKRY